MQQALRQAELAAEKGEVPVGAVVVLGGEMIGQGFNQPISSHDPTAHAEIIALRDAAQNIGNYRLPGATLYVTIEPCTMCAGAMVHARVARVVYGATEPKAGVVESNPNLLVQPYYNHAVDSDGGILAEDCSAVISAFFKRRRQEKKQP
jgi:tRNA(adenine34) deaminase